MFFEIRVALVVSMLGSFLLLAEAQERPVEHPTFYRTTQIASGEICLNESRTAVDVDLT